MSLTRPFEEAREILGVGPTEDDLRVIKKAYRQAVTEHPPDRDPDGFRRVREAYELLKEPWHKAKDLIQSTVPLIDPPKPPSLPAPRPKGWTAIAILRHLAAVADPSEWTMEAVARTSRRTKNEQPPKAA